MACPSCGSTRTIGSGGGRRKCLSPEHVGTRSYNVEREVSGELQIEAIEAKQGWAPEFGITSPLPMGQKLKGTSTLVDKRTGGTADGTVKLAAGLLAQAGQDG